MIRVCSGFHPAGFEQYGRRFLKTFHRHWPAQIDLRVYVEEPIDAPRDACRSLWDVPGAVDFRDRHRENATVHGREPVPGWKEKERRAGYSFRWDAYKFYKQILIPRKAAQDMADGDILVWLDADVVTYRDVPADLVPNLLGDTELCHLGREPKHSEIGFWAVRLTDRSRFFLEEIARVYDDDAFFVLPEWHSAYVFDFVRRRSPELNVRNLTPRGTGHVWFQSPLRRYMDHEKGQRKGRGSAEARKAGLR